MQYKAPNPAALTILLFDPAVGCDSKQPLIEDPPGRMLLGAKI